jgi:hypothetical protein
MKHFFRFSLCLFSKAYSDQDLRDAGKKKTCFVIFFLSNTTSSERSADTLEVGVAMSWYKQLYYRLVLKLLLIALGLIT